MNDLISREDAIKAVAIAALDDRDELEAIKALPSADAKGRVISAEKLKRMKFVAIKGDKTEEAYRTGWNGAIDCVIGEYASADAEQTDCTKFVNWLLDEVMDDEMWELNAVAYGEVIARKLKKLGLLEVKDGYYIRPSAEAVQGEWTYLSGSKGSYMTISCPICGSTFNDVAEWKYHYCPNCGAKMYKGGDNNEID